MTRRTRFNDDAAIRFTYDATVNAAYLYLADDVAIAHAVTDRSLGPVLAYNARD